MLFYEGGMQMAVKIYEVRKRSLCYRKGIRPGDSLISINGNEICDVLDYRFYSDEEKLILVFQKADSDKTKTVKAKIKS